MTLRILKRPKEPLLVVPTKADDIRTHLPSKSENRVNAAFGIGTSIDVVAEEYDGVVISISARSWSRRSSSADKLPWMSPIAMVAMSPGAMRSGFASDV